MRKGELVASTITESVQFTTVEDPEIGSEDEDKEDEGEEVRDELQLTTALNVFLKPQPS